MTSYARIAVNSIVEGDVVGDLGEAPGVGLADGPAKGLEGIAAVRSSEAEFVVAIENAGGLGVDLLVQPQQAKGRFHGIQPGLVLVRHLKGVAGRFPGAVDGMGAGTEPCLRLDAPKDKC